MCKLFVLNWKKLAFKNQPVVNTKLFWVVLLKILIFDKQKVYFLNLIILICTISGLIAYVGWLDN